MRWGILDTVDDLWMGENDAGDGPRVFESKEIATIAAYVMTEQLGWAFKRLKATRYDVPASKLRDTIPTKKGVLQAIQDIEEDSEP